MTLADILAVEFFWYWPGWPFAVALCGYALAGAWMMRQSARRFAVFSLIFAAVPVIAWCVANPSYGVNSGWPKVIAAALATVAVPMIIVAAPMLALERFQARYIYLVGAGLVAATVATFSFFAVAHHIGCTLTQIDCL